MSELRSRLERIGDRARSAPDAFERLERARHRRERNRRITAGTVALLVAIAGSLAAFNAFRSGDANQTVGGSGSDFFALWPESTLEAAQAVQERGVAGDPALSWRLDPMQTALGFVHDALGWPEPSDELVSSSTTSPDGIVTVDVVKEPDPGGCSLCDGRDVVIRLQRLLAGDGIWSVVSVESPVFNMPLHAGDEVELGTDLAIAAGWPDGTEVAVGFAGTGACSAFQEETVTVRDLTVRTTLAWPHAGCTGYIYALTPSTPQGQVELGGIMFVDGEKPALGYTITSITAVPVRFVEAPNQPAREGRIACDGANPIVETPVVRAQADGVHVEVSNPTDQVISFSIGPDASFADTSVSTLEPGTTALVMTDGPGRFDFSCSPPPEAGQAGVAGLGRFEVVDPDGNFVPDVLECDGGSAYGSGAAYPANAQGLQGGPVEIVRATVTGLEPDDSVETAGYRASSSPVVRVVRGGNVVGRVTLAGDGTGGWLMSSIEGCDGTSFGWTGSPTGASGSTGSSTGASGSTGPTSAWDALCASARAGGGNNVHNGVDLHVVGRDLDFDTGCLIAPAGGPLTVLFSNLDAGVPRNLSVYRLTPYLRECLVTGTSPSGKVGDPIFVGDIITGVDEIVYRMGVKPGEYYFQDDVHPQANGVLIVE